MIRQHNQGVDGHRPRQADAELLDDRVAVITKLKKTANMITARQDRPCPR